MEILKKIGAPRFGWYYVSAKVEMNIQNISVAKLHEIHKPLNVARFEHNVENEAEYVVSSGSESPETWRGNGGVRVKLDDNCANPRVKEYPKYDISVMKFDPTTFKPRGDDAGKDDKPVRKNEKPPTTWEPSDSDSVSESDDEPELDNGVLVDNSRPVASALPTTERTTFWQPKQTGPAYTLGFNANKVAQSFLENPPINKFGKPMAHPKDKVQCGVCGTVYMRKGGTGHRKSKKHIQAFNLIQVMVETALTTRKRRYYKNPNDNNNERNDDERSESE
jgi:hypothetical protein